MVLLSTTLMLAVVGLASVVESEGSLRDGASPAAFALSTRGHRRPPTRARPTALRAVPPSRAAATVAEMEAESEELRRDVAALRQEALRRLEDLNDKLTAGAPASSSSSLVDARIRETLDEQQSKEGTSGTPSTTKKKIPKGIANLLDETNWQISLNIGREPGTWMPADWGRSGQRLNLSFSAECTPAQLFDRDAFLEGGDSPAKVLRVRDNEITLGPSVAAGATAYRAKNGGWRVTRGDGPLGTDLLRFFIEVEERIARAGGDVYLPRGRVYASCGYFPVLREDGPAAKVERRRELQSMEERVRKLQDKKDRVTTPFSLEGMKLSREIFGLNRDAERMQNELNFAMVKEPDRSLLRFSKDGDVGLTKEGGVCCEVKKGLGIEYHILGRFSIASTEDE